MKNTILATWQQEKENLDVRDNQYIVKKVSCIWNYQNLGHHMLVNVRKEEPKCI